MNIYYLRRRGVPLVLSSLPAVDFGALSPETRFSIISSGFITGEEERDIAGNVAGAAHISMLRWLQDKRYIPRLIVSAALFLILYLFFSLVIRDPVPMLDELLFSFIGSVALWVLMLRADGHSSFMREKMEIIERSVYDSELSCSGDMAVIEEYYESLYSCSLMETASMIAAGTLPKLPELHDGWAEDFSSALLLHLRNCDSGIHRTLRRIEEDGEREKTVMFLVHQVSTGSLDILDLALYLALQG